MPNPLPAYKLRVTDNTVLREIDRLLDEHTDKQIAQILNDKGIRTYEGHLFTNVKVYELRRRHGLKDQYSRMREAGMLTLDEVAVALGVCTATAKTWNQRGILKGHLYNDKAQCLFDRPGKDAPVKGKFGRYGAQKV